jgi:hypothetical protein
VASEKILQLAAKCDRSARRLLRAQSFKPRTRPPLPVPIDSPEAFRYATSAVVQDCYQVLQLAHAVKESSGEDGLAVFRLGQVMLLPRLRKAMGAVERDEKIKKGRERSLAARQNKTEGPRTAFRARYVAAFKAHPNWTKHGLCIEVRRQHLRQRKMPSLNTAHRWTEDLPPFPRRKRS